MPTRSPTPDVRDLLRERLDTLLDECNQVTDNAAYGQTIHDLDDFLLIAGKKFLQEVMQQKLHERIKQAEQPVNSGFQPESSPIFNRNSQERISRSGGWFVVIDSTCLAFQTPYLVLSDSAKSVIRGDG